MRGVIRRWLPGREGVGGAEGSSAAIEVRKQVSAIPAMSLLTRLGLAAALYNPAPPRKPGPKGRPRKKGARRPPLPQGLADSPTQGTPRPVNHWEGGGKRAVEGCPDTAVWDQAGLPPVTLWGVLIRDPQNAFAPQALGTTCLWHTPPQRVEGFVRRWQREGTFEEAQRSARD